MTAPADALRECAARIAQAAPPLSSEQRTRLGSLLSLPRTYGISGVSTELPLVAESDHLALSNGN